MSKPKLIVMKNLYHKLSIKALTDKMRIEKDHIVCISSKATFESLMVKLSIKKETLPVLKLKKNG
jgi:hypothetical protein